MSNDSSNSDGLTALQATKNASARLPWNAPLAVVCAVIAFFVTQIIASVLVITIPSLRHQDINWWLNTTPGQFAYVLTAEALIVAAVVGFVKFHKVPLARIGLTRRVSWKDPVVAIPAYLIYLALFLIAVSLIENFVPSINVNQEQQIGFTDVHGIGAYVLTFISLVILPPIAEEILLRGFVYTTLRKHLKFIGAALITSALFAAAHLPEGGAAGPLYIAAVDTFILSIVLCFLRERTGRLYAGITVHMLKNLVAFISLFVLVSR